MANEHKSAVDQSGPTLLGTVTSRRLFEIEHATITWMVSAALGFALIVNQAGEGLARVVRDFVDITWLSVFWLVNLPVATTGGRWFLGACLLLIGAAYYLLWRKHPAPHIRAAFYLGLWSGLLVLPALLLSIAVAVLILFVVGYVLYWLAMAVAWVLSATFIYVIGPVLGFVAIPFIWLWENALRPTLNFLSIPFVWVWATILDPVLSVIAIPLVWLWANAVLPLLTFIVTIILKWLAIAIVVVVAAVMLLLLTFSMFGAVWKVFEESFRNAAQGEFTEQTAFACGIGAGLFLFDLSLA